VGYFLSPLWGWGRGLGDGSEPFLEKPFKDSSFGFRTINDSLVSLECLRHGDERRSHKSRFFGVRGMNLDVGQSHMKTANWSAVTFALLYKFSDSGLHGRLHPRLKMKIARLRSKRHILRITRWRNPKCESGNVTATRRHLIDVPDRLANFVRDGGEAHKI